METLVEGVDSKGIRCKIGQDHAAKIIEVVVWYGPEAKTRKFSMNRFSFQLGDYVNAVKIADELASEIERGLQI